MLSGGHRLNLLHSDHFEDVVVEEPLGFSVLASTARLRREVQFLSDAGRQLGDHLPEFVSCSGRSILQPLAKLALEEERHNVRDFKARESDQVDLLLQGTKTCKVSFPLFGDLHPLVPHKRREVGVHEVETSPRDAVPAQPLPAPLQHC